MKSKREYLKTGYFVFRMVIITTIIAYTMGKYCTILETPIGALLVSTIICEGIYLVQNSRHYKKIYLGTAVLLMLAVFVTPMEKLLPFFDRYACIFLLIGIGYLLFWTEKKLKIRIGIAVFVMGLLLYLGTKQPEYSRLILGMGIFYILDVLLQICQIKGKEEKNEKYSTIYLFPIIFLMIAVCTILPAKEKPISWEFVKKEVKEVKEIIVDYIYTQYAKGGGWTEDFSIATTGYGDGNTSFFGGKLFKSDTVVLKVESSDKIYNRIYLAGTIRDVYNGHGWEKTESKNTNYSEYKLSLFEKMYSLYQGGVLDLEQGAGYHSAYIRIRLETMKTKSVFYPENCYNIASMGVDAKRLEKGPNQYWSKTARKGDYYIANFLEINKEDEGFQKHIRQENGNDYSNQKLEQFHEYINQNADTLMYGTINEVLDNPNLVRDLEARQKEINERYLQLPSDLPKRVNELAWQLTKDKTNDFDKIEALQMYLKDMSYATNIKKQDEKKDAVDTFLFEDKEGYCTYFASSLAVMSRCIGIPARYVEGMAVNCHKNTKAVYPVMASGTHAWAEVYIKGYGWITAEATPRYGQGTAKNRWPKEEAVVGNPNVDLGKPASANETLQELKEQEQEVHFWERSEVKIIAAVLIIIIGILCIFIVSLWIRKWRKKREYRGVTGRKKVILYMQTIVAYLEYLGYPFAEGETIEAYRKGAEKEEELKEIALGTLLSNYETLRYSDRIPGDDEIELFGKGMEALKQMCIAKKGKLRFILYM